MPYTPPVYPGAIPTQTGPTPDLPDRIDDLDWLYAARYNELKKELCAALAELGVLPKGSYASVVARLNAMIDIANLANGDIIIRSGGVWARLPKGDDAKILTLVDGLPAWAAAGGDGIPSGLIAIWHGLISAIPSGWVICDGNNSTPNLLDKFVKGVPTAATNPGTTGGAATHKHAQTAHVHAQTIHLHAQAQHVHPNNLAISAHSESYISEGEGSGYGLCQYPSTQSLSGGIQNSAAVNTGNSAAVDTGSGGAVDTATADGRPPYYEVAFIMKT